LMSEIFGLVAPAQTSGPICHRQDAFSVRVQG
jgi:hypothetical protein